MSGEVGTHAAAMESTMSLELGGFSPPALACFACREAHTACSKERPCKRCASLGKACFDPEKKKRGRPKKKIEQQLRQQHHQHQQLREHPGAQPLPPRKKSRTSGGTELLPPLLPVQPGGDGLLAGMATTTSTLSSPTPLLPHFFGNVGSGWQPTAAAGPGVEARPRHATAAPPADGRHAGDHRVGADVLVADTTRTGRHHRPTAARRDTGVVVGDRTEGLSGNLLCLLVDHMKELKREVRETKRRQDGIEDLLRDLTSKVDAIPSLIATAVAAQSTSASSSSASSSSPSPSSSSPLEDYGATLLSPSVPVLDCTAAVRHALQLSDGGYAPASFTLLPGLVVVPPRQQIAALFPFLDEYNLGTCNQPFVCDNPGKPVVVLRCIPQTSPGEEGTAPIIVYINDPFCSLMGFTRDELVGSPVTKLAMADFTFFDEVGKRFLSPPGTLIGDVFSVSMLVMKRNGMPARAHNRFQFFYNGMRRQRWLFSVTDGLDESNIPFAPSDLLTPAISYRSELQSEQQAQMLEQESMAAFRQGLPALRSAPSTFCGRQQPTTNADRSGGDFGGNGAYGAQHGAPYFAYGPAETQTATTPSSGDGPSPGAQPQQEPFAEEEADSIGDLLASMGGPSPSPLGFPASPYATFSSFY